MNAKFIKPLRWLVNNYVHVAFCSASLHFFMAISQKGNQHFWFVFWSTLLVYHELNVTKSFHINRQLKYIFQHPYSRQWIWIAVSTGMTIYYALSLSIQECLVVMMVVPMVFLYSVEGTKGLRNIARLKVWIISLSWLIVCGVLPIANLDFQKTNIPILLSLWLFLIGITIPFDIRDIRYDMPSLKSVPQVLGTDVSFKIAMVLLLISPLFFFMGKKNEILNLSWAISCIFGIVLIYQYKKTLDDFRLDFFIEGIAALPLLLYWFIEFILKY